MSNWLFSGRDEVGGTTEGSDGVGPADADIDPEEAEIDDRRVVSSPGDLTGVGTN